MYHELCTCHNVQYTQLQEYIWNMHWCYWKAVMAVPDTTCYTNCVKRTHASMSTSHSPVISTTRNYCHNITMLYNVPWRNTVAAVPDIINTQVDYEHIRIHVHTTFIRPLKNSKTPRHHKITPLHPKLWRQCQASQHPIDYTNQRIRHDTDCPLKNEKNQRRYVTLVYPKL